MTREEIQTKINSLASNLTAAQMRSQMSTWLDQTDLSVGTLTHEFIRDHILDDLNSYEGGK